MSSTPPPDSWSTQVDGETVALPSTVAGIRAALPDARRAEFDAALAELDAVGAPEELRTLRLVRLVRLVWWALEAVPGAVEETDAEIARLRAGDYSGVVTLDENGDLVSLDGAA
ncbi:hypothetical protein [Streptomyces clavuligerus]|nr:hypothetical protein [Streptomyces clavuligerus]AXU16843.1 hypothetical protein D1794_29195 [Streptomyces clavuligerus]MBY6300976.1 hypothetical protein [Streptomyces clavuligerus]QPJ97012.1 hypothetical protein GE265_28270 [Streptomyces clavuligerus]WDN55786.1 hypothetical protein LL058_28225 [Streptomyces clavuligerus]